MGRAAPVQHRSRVESAGRCRPSGSTHFLSVCVAAAVDAGGAKGPGDVSPVSGAERRFGPRGSIEPYQRDPDVDGQEGSRAGTPSAHAVWQLDADGRTKASLTGTASHSNRPRRHGVNGEIFLGQAGRQGPPYGYDTVSRNERIRRSTCPSS